MNKQEIFSKVRRKLLDQMDQSSDDNDGCLYRGDKDLKCAIGHLIPDELYDPKIEGLSIRSIGDHPPCNRTEALILKDILEQLNISTDKYCLLSELQDMHDQEEPPRWESRLAEIADAHGLKNE